MISNSNFVDFLKQFSCAIFLYYLSAFFWLTKETDINWCYVVRNKAEIEIWRNPWFRENTGIFKNEFNSIETDELDLIWEFWLRVLEIHLFLHLLDSSINYSLLSHAIEFFYSFVCAIIDFIFSFFEFPSLVWNSTILFFLFFTCFNFFIIFLLLFVYCVDNTLFVFFTFIFLSYFFKFLNLMS